MNYEEVLIVLNPGYHSALKQNNKNHVIETKDKKENFVDFQFSIATMLLCTKNIL